MTPIELFRELEKLGIEVPRVTVYGEGLAYEPSAGYIHPDDFISLAEKAMRVWLRERTSLNIYYIKSTKEYYCACVFERKDIALKSRVEPTEAQALLAACQAVNEGE